MHVSKLVAMALLTLAMAWLADRAPRGLGEDAGRIVPQTPSPATPPVPAVPQQGSQREGPPAFRA